MERASESLAMRPEQILDVGDRAGSEHRHLHVIRKSGPTPANLPRKSGMAKKRPPADAPSLSSKAPALNPAAPERDLTLSERLVTRACPNLGRPEHDLPEFERGEGQIPPPSPEKGPPPGALLLRRFFFFGGLGGGFAARFSSGVATCGAGITLLIVIPCPIVQRLVVIQ